MSTTLLRLGFGVATAAVVTAGSVYVVETDPGAYDANFFGLLATALLPSLIYGLGVRDRRSTAVCGWLLLGITVFGWVFILQDDPMRGVGAVLAFLATLIVAMTYAFRDRSRNW